MGDIAGSLLVGELIMNESKYPDMLNSARKVCATMAKKIGITRADLCENLQVRLNALLATSTSTDQKLTSLIGG